MGNAETVHSIVVNRNNARREMKNKEEEGKGERETSKRSQSGDRILL